MESRRHPSLRPAPGKVSMVTGAARLVVVAYPSDEALAFSSVSENSDVVAVGSCYQNVSPEVLNLEFQEAAAQLGARRALYLDLYSDDSFPAEALESKLRALGPYQRVYTHSPFDEDPFRVNTVLAVNRVFSPIWVQAKGGPAMETNALDIGQFHRKMDIVNALYCERIRPQEEGGAVSYTALLGVEAFTQVNHNEVVRAVAVSSDQILSLPDVWGFGSSPYELERCSSTCQLLLDQVDPGAVKDIMDIGACEGEMTQQLSRAFPNARVRAVESEPFFAERLESRFREDKNITVLRCSMTNVPLEADVVVLAEVLYYLEEEDMQKTLERLQARYAVVSCDGELDLVLSEALAGLGWHKLGARRVRPRFEPVDGSQSRLISCRQGTNIRLWERR